LWFQASPGEKKKKVCETIISRIIRAKWTGGMAQAVELLLCEPKPQVQTPVLPKEKKKVLKTPKNIFACVIATHFHHDRNSS
jgi:hypothetical protein